MLATFYAWTVRVRSAAIDDTSHCIGWSFGGQATRKPPIYNHFGISGENRITRLFFLFLFLYGESDHLVIKE